MDRILSSNFLKKENYFRYLDEFPVTYLPKDLQYLHLKERNLYGHQLPDISCPTELIKLNESHFLTETHTDGQLRGKHIMNDKEEHLTDFIATDKEAARTVAASIFKVPKTWVSVLKTSPHFVVEAFHPIARVVNITNGELIEDIHNIPYDYLGSSEYDNLCCFDIQDLFKRGIHIGADRSVIRNHDTVLNVKEPLQMLDKVDHFCGYHLLELSNGERTYAPIADMSNDNKACFAFALINARQGRVFRSIVTLQRYFRMKRETTLNNREKSDEDVSLQVPAWKKFRGNGLDF